MRVARALDQALGGGTPTVAPAGGGQAGAAEAGTGTRANPLPLGTAVSNSNWSITVNSFTADATRSVMAENQFNDEPTAGSTYALVNVTVTRAGADEASPTFEVGVDYVTSQGNVITTADAMAVGPDGLSSNELFEGASATGNIVLQIPEGDAGTIRVRPGLFADEVFYSIG